MQYIFWFLYLAGAVVGLLIFYYVICSAVKNGILDAKKEIDKKA